MLQDPWSKVSILPGMISESLLQSKYITWYDFRILYPEKVHCLVWFQDPLSWERIACYDFRIFYLEKIYCLVWFPDPLSWEFVSLNSRRCTWLCPCLAGVLESLCVSAPPGNCLQIWLPGKMTSTARAASKFCARDRSQSPNIFDIVLISYLPWPDCQP